jgi:hypothetical protein
MNVKPRKYGNIKCEADGYKFDSLAERGHYFKLKILARTGEISDLRLQVPFELQPGALLHGHARKSPAMKYTADFVYLDKDGRQVIEDVKGVKTTAFTIKKHLMKTLMGLDVVEV